MSARGACARAVRRWMHACAPRVRQVFGLIYEMYQTIVVRRAAYYVSVAVSHTHTHTRLQRPRGRRDLYTAYARARPACIRHNARTAALDRLRY
jgi:hypothetical protein